MNHQPALDSPRFWLENEDYFQGMVLHLIDIHRTILNRNLCFPTGEGPLALQHLGHMVHYNGGILVPGRLHAGSHGAGHAPGLGIRKAVWIHIESPIKGDQSGIRDEGIGPAFAR